MAKETNIDTMEVNSVGSIDIKEAGTSSSSTSNTVEVTTKSFNTVILEGALYFIISAFTPIVTVLESDKALDARSITAMIIASIVAGSVALKAFFSQSVSTPTSTT